MRTAEDGAVRFQQAEWGEDGGFRGVVHARGVRQPVHSAITQTHQGPLLPLRRFPHAAAQSSFFNILIFVNSF